MQFKSMQMAFKPCTLRAKNDFRYGVTFHIQSAFICRGPKPVMACVLPLLCRRCLMWKQDMKTNGHYHFETINIQNKNQKKKLILLDIILSICCILVRICSFYKNKILLRTKLPYLKTRKDRMIVARLTFLLTVTP